MNDNHTSTTMKIFNITNNIYHNNYNDQKENSLHFNSYMNRFGISSRNYGIITFTARVDSEQAKKIIILLGAPNSGKGTTARGLSERLSIPYVGGSDILKEQAKNPVSFNIIANQLMETLGQVPKYAQIAKVLICKVIKERLNLPAYKKGFILEGFPRSIEEADMLNNILKNEDNLEIKVVNLDVDIPILYKRSANRFVCKDCNKSYSFLGGGLSIKRCDCGGELVKREDDTPEILNRRILKYKNNTLPLLDYYGDKAVTIHVADGSMSVLEVLNNVLSKITTKNDVNLP